MLAESAVGDTVIVGALISAVGGLAAFTKWLIDRALTSADTETERLHKENERLDTKVDDLQGKLTDALVAESNASTRAAKFERELMAKDAELESLRSQVVAAEAAAARATE